MLPCPWKRLLLTLHVCRQQKQQYMVYFVLDNVVYMGAIHNRKNAQIDLICIVYSNNKQVRKNTIKSHWGPPLLDLILVSSRRRLNKDKKNTLNWNKNVLFKIQTTILDWPVKRNGQLHRCWPSPDIHMTLYHLKSYQQCCSAFIFVVYIWF